MAIVRFSLVLWLAFGLAAAVSCKYDPHPPDGNQKCAGTDAGKQCPSGYECRAGKCYNTPADGGGSHLHALPATGGNGGGNGDTKASLPESDAGVAEAGAEAALQAWPAAD